VQPELKSCKDDLDYSEDVNLFLRSELEELEYNYEDLKYEMENLNKTCQDLTGSYNSNSVLEIYKNRTENTWEMFDLLLNASENTPSQLCPNIMDAYYTKEKDNVYWMLQDDLSRLISDYGSYRNQIEYIDNNLNAIAGGIQLINHNCQIIGYTLP